MERVGSYPQSCINPIDDAVTVRVPAGEFTMGSDRGV